MAIPPRSAPCFAILRLERLFILLVSLLAACSAPADSAVPLGCAVVHASGLCELETDRNFALRVVAPASTRIFVLQGLHVLPVQTEAVPGGRILRGVARAGVSGLSVVFADGISLRRRSLPVAVALEPAWLEEARNLWMTNSAAQAAALINRHLESSSPAIRASALLVLGGTAVELGELAHARQCYRMAMETAQAAGLSSIEAKSALYLSYVLAKHENRVDEADAVLAQRSGLFQRLPDTLPGLALQRAINAHTQGDPRSTLRIIEEGHQSARAVADESTDRNLSLLEAQALSGLGRRSEAERILTALEAQPLEPCWRLIVLLAASGQQLWSLEAEGPLKRAAHAAAIQHRLDEAERLITSHCSDARRMGTTHTNRAHLALLTGDLPAVKREVAQARKALPGGDAELALEWLYLDGQSALIEQDFASAWQHFDKLVKMARRSDAYSALWRGLVGLAQARQAAEPGKALELYEQAEAFIDERGLDMPLGAGRGTFLGRHEHGTEQYVALLLRLGQTEAALQVVRKARLRGLRSLLWQVQSGDLPPEIRRHWASQLTAYAAARSELAQLSARLETAPDDELADLERRRAQVGLSLFEHLDRARTIIGAPPIPKTFAAPPPDEALLTCYPTNEDWSCFLVQNHHVKVYRAAHMDAGMRPADLARTILAPIATELAAVKRLRVLPYGAFRKVDVHRLPFGRDGKTLDDHTAVVYSLDLPNRPTSFDDKHWAHSSSSEASTKAARAAALIIDPDGSLPYVRAAAGSITASLQAAGFQVQPLPAAALGGPWFTQPAPAPTRSPLELLFYAGHADIVTSGGSRHALRTQDNGGLFVSDILALHESQAPKWVALIGCNTGLSDEETGGLEGLGLGQAFLLRGSTMVVSTTRPISDRLAAAIVVKLGKQLTAQVDGDLGSALQGALKEVADSDRASLPLNIQHELDAFRILVP